MELTIEEFMEAYEMTLEQFEKEVMGKEKLEIYYRFSDDKTLITEETQEKWRNRKN